MQGPLQISPATFASVVAWVKIIRTFKCDSLRSGLCALKSGVRRVLEKHGHFPSVSVWVLVHHGFTLLLELKVSEADF